MDPVHQVQLMAAVIARPTHMWVTISSREPLRGTGEGRCKGPTLPSGYSSLNAAIAFPPERGRY